MIMVSFFGRGLIVDTSSLPAGLYRSTCGLFYILFAPSVLNSHPFFESVLVRVQNRAQLSGVYQSSCLVLAMCTQVTEEWNST